jgi:hypothetical protein
MHSTAAETFVEIMTTPEPCPYCGEPVAPGEARAIAVVGLAGVPGTSSLAIHRECLLRQFVGSVGHQLGTCSCHGGTADDPPGMTRREAAIAATELYRMRRGS